jgi:hypothetical protein
MRIGITLNEVFRDFLGQLVYTCDKYNKLPMEMRENEEGEEQLLPIEIKEGDITEFDFLKYFTFADKTELNKFLYFEESLEVFGHADQLIDNVFMHFNQFLMDVQDEEEHEIILVSREFNKSIPSTYFFLSKVGCRADKIEFVKNFEDKWDNVDVLVTANPIALENKPDGKISVKVNASYNKDTNADFEIDSILDFIHDEELRNNILNTKMTSYEEID